MVQEFLSNDELLKVYIDDSQGGAIKLKEMSTNDIYSFTPVDEDKEEILAMMFPGFAAGNLLLKIGRAIERALT